MFTSAGDRAGRKLPPIKKLPDIFPTGSTFTFPVPSGYSNIEIRWLARGTQSATAVDLQIQYNGDTGANYDVELLYNSSATAAAAFEILAANQGTVGTLSAATATAGRAGGGVIKINNYGSTLFNKVATSDNHWAQAATTTNILTRLFGNTWRSTVPISTITLKLSAGSFATGSKFSIYMYL